MLGREFHWHHIFHKTPFGYVYAIGFFNVCAPNKVYWFQKHSNVQGLVEVAYVYILARSGSSTKDQLLYVPARLEDIEDLALKLDVDGKKYRDILRFFSGDTPARQLEAGHQCGGRFNLWSKPLLCMEAISLAIVTKIMHLKWLDDKIQHWRNQGKFPDKAVTVNSLSLFTMI